MVEVLDRNDAVSEGNIPPGSGLPLARLNNAYDTQFPFLSTACTPSEDNNTYSNLISSCEHKRDFIFHIA